MSIILGVKCEPIAILDVRAINRFIKAPRGIVEDVFIKVDKFYYSVDFVVLDTQPVVDSHVQNHIPIILG